VRDKIVVGGWKTCVAERQELSGGENLTELERSSSPRILDWSGPGRQKSWASVQRLVRHILDQYDRYFLVYCECKERN